MNRGGGHGARGRGYRVWGDLENNNSDYNNIRIKDHFPAYNVGTCRDRNNALWQIISYYKLAGPYLRGGEGGGPMRHSAPPRV